jgi:hypothetical protein
MKIGSDQECTLINVEKNYDDFDSSISMINCGERCAPYNDYGVPFCCDISQMIPTAYDFEWEYLRVNTNLWRIWEADEENAHLNDQVPEGQVMIACLGYRFCEREFRSFTCRAFPFFPYIQLSGEFIGLSYYWEFEDLCWVISNLQSVSDEFRKQFINFYDGLFKEKPEEHENFRSYSIDMRRIYGRRHRSIPLLHRDGINYLCTPKDGNLTPCGPDQFPKYGPFKVAEDIPFPDGT